MRYGVNYVPTKNWWHSWVDWEPTAMEEDLRAVAALGMDHIRIQLVWPVFQPDPTWVSPLLLDRLTAFMGLADTAGLDVWVSVLDGWLSGMYLRPAWHGERASMFSDPRVIRAQRLLLREVAGAIGVHDRLLGIDIGNEPNVLTQFVGNTSTTASEAGAWTRNLLDLAAELLPNKEHVIGFDHAPWMTKTVFSREVIAETGTMTAIHAWTEFTGALRRYGARGTGALHLGEYLVELAKAFASDPARQVWLQEYGASSRWMPEEQIAEHALAFTRAVLDVPLLWGVTWWCSHDIDRRFSAFAELEYDLGLLTVDNAVKPVGAALRDLIADTGSEVTPAARTTALVLPEGRTPDLEFADEFFDLISAGERPRIVRSGQFLV